MNTNINSPEFWERVKQDFLTKGCISLCAASPDFKKLWWRVATEQQICNFANDFLGNGLNYKMFNVGATNLFYCYCNDSKNPIHRRIRLDFLDYMINRTRNEHGTIQNAG